MSKIYLDLEEREGRFFQYSKEPKEGFTKHETTTGNVSYRKIYDKGLVGKLKYINEIEQDFGKGSFKVASIAVENTDGDVLYARIPLLTSRGGLNDYFEQLVPYLPNLSVGETYRIFPYAMEIEYETKTGEKKKGIRKGFSIHVFDVDNDAKGDKVERAHNFGKDGDIPAIVWREEEDMDVVKNIKDDKDRRNFLYKVFKSIATSKEKSEAPQAKPEPAPKADEAPKSRQFEDEDHDDLPF